MPYHQSRGRIPRILLLFFLCTTLLLSSTAFAVKAEAAKDTDLIQEVLDYIESHNIEGVTREDLIQAAIYGMVYSLDDPYTDYFTADELKDFENQLSATFVGVGISVLFNEAKVEVQYVYPNSPASEAGMQAGDIITAINGKNITDEQSYANLISGKEGSSVTLTILRGEQKQMFKMTRREVKIDTVTSAIMDKNKGIGYISLLQFAQDSDELFEQHLNQLKQQGISSLVLDLRDNPGGYIDTANNIAKQFIDKGLLMFTKDNSGVLEPFVITDGKKNDLDVYVLVNENSASASEVLSSALQDQGYATLIGMQTYGKARIQSMISLSDGGMLKLTTQSYVTPNKTDFNHIGIKPDIEVKGSLAQLITAIKLADVDKVTLQSSTSGLKINGQSFQDRLDYVVKGSKLYVSSRTLGALVEASPAWSSSKKAVEFTTSTGKKISYGTANQAAIVAEGITYVDVQVFQKSFSGFAWSMKDKNITITATY